MVAAEKQKSLSAFDDKSKRPVETELHCALGLSAGAWKDLIVHISETYGPSTEHWNFAGARYGWSLRLKKEDRIVLYLTPQVGHFLVGIVLGAKAVAAAQSANLPPHVLKAIDEATRYAEGTGLRLPISRKSQLPSIKKLVALKMAPR